MQPWKIGIGLTATLLGLSVLIAGDHFAYLKPHLPAILTDYWRPVAWFRTIWAKAASTISRR